MLGKGTAPSGDPRSISVNSTAVAVQLADLDGDGKLDLAVTTGWSGCEPRHIEGRGYGTFDPAIHFCGAQPRRTGGCGFQWRRQSDVAVANPPFSGNHGYRAVE